MKKILFGILFVFCFTTSVFGATTTNWDSAVALQKVNTIGQKILKANSLPTQVEFKVSDEEHVNAYATIDKEVYVYRGLLEFVQDDTELAAVISHELGHIINGHCARQTILSGLMANFLGTPSDTNLNETSTLAQNLVSLKMSRSDEYEADITGAELMQNAGYNPLGMISVLNKICENSIDVFSTHPSGEKRLMNIYNYMTYVYPDLKKKTYNSESYKAAYVVIKENVDKINKNEKTLAKHNKKMAKLKAKRAKALAKAKVTGGSGWDTSYAILKILSTESSSESGQ